MGNNNTTPEEAVAIANKSGDVYPPITFDGESHIKVPKNVSLPKKELVNKIKGIIYGTFVHRNLI
jgi:hypothetical protein